MPVFRTLHALSEAVIKISEQTQRRNQLLVAQYLETSLFSNSRYKTDAMLNRYEQKVFSQNGEDGIIQEIFRRIGTNKKFFVEFGVQDGLECNTTALIQQGWKGVWIEGDREDYRKICENFGPFINHQSLKVSHQFVQPGNFEAILNALSVPAEFDLLSIDIDFNDYWVWKALKNFKPAAVVIEYNAFYPPPIEFVATYNSHASHQPSNYFGASLKSLEILGQEKGYQLVGCDFAGVNAFFVRSDLAKGKFAEPALAKTFYEPFRPFLYDGRPKGLHPPDAPSTSTTPTYDA